jgi:hypothetical protein
MAYDRVDAREHQRRTLVAELLEVRAARRRDPWWRMLREGALVHWVFWVLRGVFFLVCSVLFAFLLGAMAVPLLAVSARRIVAEVEARVSYAVTVVADWSVGGSHGPDALAEAR